MEGISVPEPLEHSVLDVDLDGRPMEGISVPEPLEHSVLDIDRDGRPMEGISVPEPLEHSVMDVYVDLDGRPMEGISVLEPLRAFGSGRGPGARIHGGGVGSGTVRAFGSGGDLGPTRGIAVMEPLEHSVPDVAPVWGVRSFIKMAASDPLEHSGLTRADDVGQKLVPLEPLEHSVLVDRVTYRSLM